MKVTVDTYTDSAQWIASVSHWWCPKCHWRSTTRWIHKYALYDADGTQEHICRECNTEIERSAPIIAAEVTHGHR